MPVEIRLRQEGVPVEGASSTMRLATVPSETTGFYDLATGEAARISFLPRRGTRPMQVVIDGLQEPVLRGARDRALRTVQLDYYGFGSTDLGGGSALEVDFGRTGLYEPKKHRQRELERREAIELAKIRIEPIRERSDLVYEHEIVDHDEFGVRKIVADKAFKFMLGTGTSREQLYEPFPYPSGTMKDFEGNPLPSGLIRILTSLPKDDDRRARFHELIKEAREIQVGNHAAGITKEEAGKILADYIDRRLPELDIF